MPGAYLPLVVRPTAHDASPEITHAIDGLLADASMLASGFGMWRTADRYLSPDGKASLDGLMSDIGGRLALKAGALLSAMETEEVSEEQWLAMWMDAGASRLDLFDRLVDRATRLGFAGPMTTAASPIPSKADVTAFLASLMKLGGASVRLGTR